MKKQRRCRNVPSTAAPFLWPPGAGPDADALARMRHAFPRPKEPMGEAWFISETRKTFNSLVGDLRGLPLLDIEEALFELASGTRNLGRHEEWQLWFHHILAETLPRANEHRALHSYSESLVTAFMALSQCVRE